MKLTVTDNKGATGTTTNNVTVTVPNVAPTASFTVSTDGAATANVDATGSKDTDGTIASYAWDWGDGSAAGSGLTATHTYAKSGTYTIKLTVTDNQGATGSTTNPVTAIAANVPPTAAFTSSSNGLNLNVDGSGSSDSDGTISSYAWDFGDTNNPTGDTATGKTATYQYSQAGTYTVTLTVTDDRSGTASVTHAVNVSAVTFIANDTFNRTVNNGWGTADIGGAWTTVNGTAANIKVAPGAGTFTQGAGSTYREILGSVSSSSATSSEEFSLDKLPTGSGTADGMYVSLVGRRVGTDEYLARLTLNGNGTAVLYLLRDGVSMGSYTVPTALAANTKYMLKISVTGTSPTTIAAKFWPSAGTEPSTWQVSKVDTGTTAPTLNLAAPGSVGLWSTVASATTNGPIKLSVDSFQTQ